MKKVKAVKSPSEEYQRFEKLAKSLIAVPKSEIDKREAEYQRAKKAAKKRKIAKRGQKIDCAQCRSIWEGVMGLRLRRSNFV